MATFGLICTCGVHHQSDLGSKEYKEVIHCTCGVVWTLTKALTTTTAFRVDDEVTHVDHADYGVGIVKEISASGKKVKAEFPHYDKKKYLWPPKGYYSPEKLVPKGTDKQ